MSSQTHSSNRSCTFNITRLLHASAPVAMVLLGSLWLTGCDTPANQEDRKVQADIAAAQDTISQADSIGATDQQIQQGTAARKALEAAAADQLITPLVKTQAKAALAQAELNAASKTMRQIDLDNGNLHGLIYEISQLAQQVEASRSMAASYDKYDPKPAHDAIAQRIADAQGGPDKPDWVKLDNTTIPSLAAVTQTISQLQGQLAKQADDLKSLQDQRTQILDEADQADKSSEVSKGQQSVDDFTRAAGLRKQAGDLTVQIEKNQAQTIPLQKDLAVAQGQQTVLQALIQELGDQSTALDAGWKSVQAAVASQAVLQKQIVAGSGEPTAAPVAPADQTAAAGAPTTASILSPTAGLSLNEKADALKQLVQQISAEQSDAIANLHNASTHYGDAGSAAAAYIAVLDPIMRDPNNAKSPKQDAWKNLEDTVNPALYKLKVALAQRQLAELYVAQVDNDNLRAKMQDEVTKVLGAANIPVPAALAETGIDADKTTAGKSASDAYAAANDQLLNLSHGSVPVPVKAIVGVQTILTNYGQVQLARLTGDTTTASTALDAAKSAVSDAVQNGLQLPPLPPELAAAVAPATPAP
jgi:hypothetical protein